MQVPLKGFASAQSKLYEEKKPIEIEYLQTYICVRKIDDMILNVLNTIEFSQNQPNKYI